MNAQTPPKPPRTRKPHRPGIDPVPAKVRAELTLAVLAPKPSPKAELPALPKRPTGARELFADARQRAAEMEFAFQKLRADGNLNALRSDVQFVGTSMDRNFSQGEFEAICWFAPFHAIVIGGMLKLRGDVLDAALAELDEYDIRLLNHVLRDPVARAEYADVAGQLPEAFLIIMEWVAARKYPQFFVRIDEPIPNKVELAAAMFASTNDACLRANLDGLFKGVCQVIVDARARRETLANREQSQQEGYAGHRANRTISNS